MKQLLSIGCIALLALLCRYSAACAQAVRAALSLCLTSAVPALFPFFAVSSLAVASGLAQTIGNLLAQPMRRAFRLPPCGAAALVLGFLGGYPAGARLAAELWRSGACTKEEAEALAACCNNTGPAFLIGMCGTGLFHSLRVGIFLYCIHIASALMTAFLLRPKQLPTCREMTGAQDLPPFSRCLTQAVTAAGRSCLTVSAFILFFSVILCLLRQLGVFSLLPSPLLCAVCTGCIELTQGLAMLTDGTGSYAMRLIAVSFLCAFGGLSVLCQTAAVTDGLSVLRCIRGKCLHAILAAGLCALAVFFYDHSFAQIFL